MLSSQSPPCSSSSYSPSPSSPSSCSDSESSTSTTNSNSSGSDDGGGFLHVRCWKAEMLAEALVNPHVPLVLLDVRSSSSATIIGNIQYSLCAGNIPTALVKRAAFPLQRLVRDFVKEDSAHHRLLLNHLLYKKEAGCCGEEITPMHIVVYDQDTHSSIKPASLLDLIVARLDRETFTSRICVHWLNGGFDAFSSQYSSLCNLVVAKSSENGSDTTETSPAYEKGNETPPECLPFDVLSKDSYFLIKDNKVSSIPTFLRSLMENGDILEDLAMKWKVQSC